MIFHNMTTNIYFYFIFGGLLVFFSLFFRTEGCVLVLQTKFYPIILIKLICVLKLMVTFTNYIAFNFKIEYVFRKLIEQCFMDWDKTKLTII